MVATTSASNTMYGMPHTVSDSTCCMDQVFENDPDQVKHGDWDDEKE